MSDTSVIGAFSAEHAERLTGVSAAQLRRWDRTKLLQPSYVSSEGGPFSRLYSFRDLVALRVLNGLRNEHGVSLQHLREVARHLEHLGDAKWTGTTLYVLGKRVVFDNPRTGDREEVVGGQRVFDIPIGVAAGDVRQAIRDMNKRGPEDVGRIVQKRNVMQNVPVFARTRIPISAVQSYLDAGYDDGAILREFPSLSAEDIAAARERNGRRAA